MSELKHPLPIGAVAQERHTDYVHTITGRAFEYEGYSDDGGWVYFTQDHGEIYAEDLVRVRGRHAAPEPVVEYHEGVPVGYSY